MLGAKSYHNEMYNQNRNKHKSGGDSIETLDMAGVFSLNE